MLPEHRDRVVLNVKKAVGTLQKVQEMLEKDVYCMDVAQQINAAMGLLRKANHEVMESHLMTCGHRMAGDDPEDRQRFIQEIIQVFSVTGRKQ